MVQPISIAPPNTMFHDTEYLHCSKEKQINGERKELSENKMFSEPSDFFVFQGKCKIKSLYIFTYTLHIFPTYSHQKGISFLLVIVICTESPAMVRADFSLNKCHIMTKI